MEYYAHNPLTPPNPNNPNPIPYPYPYPYYPYNPTAYPPPPPPAAAVDSSASVPPPSGYEAYAYGGYVDQNQTAVSVAPDLSNAHLRQAVQLFGTDPDAYRVAGAAPNGTAQMSVPNSTFHGKTSLKKRKKNPTKVVASAYCEICSVDCSSVESLDQHKLGKKHKKKLEKLQQAANADVGPKTRRKAVQTVEDLEMKRRKVVEGGTAIEDVKTCTICNVVCNSEVVYKYHLAGQKHASMLKKKQAAAMCVPANVQTQV